MLCCVFCDQPVDSEDTCCTCGYIDPLRSILGKTFNSEQETLNVLSQYLQMQISSDEHVTALNKQLPELREAFAECSEAHRQQMEDVDAFQQQIDEIDALTQFKTTLLDAYKNSSYSINLDDHQKETDMRVKAGVWEVIRCPSSQDCKGRVFKTTGGCSICQVSVCFECFEITHGPHHVCDEAKKASVQAMMTSSLPCPLCFTPIQKSEGCDQMFCTICHHAFDYQSHTTISRDLLHNPEFQEFLEREGAQEKGGEATSWVREHLFLKRRDDVIARITGQRVLSPEEESDKELVLMKGTTHHLVVWHPNTTNIHSTKLRFGIASNEDNALVASISVKQNGWWSRVMSSGGKEIVNRFDSSWLGSGDMYQRVLQLSKRIKTTDEVPDNENILKKIQWMEGEISDDEYARCVLALIKESSFERFKWTTLKHYLTGMVTLNGMVLRYMEQIYSMAQAFPDEMVAEIEASKGTTAPSDAADVFIKRVEGVINTCFDTVDIVMDNAQGIMASKNNNINTCFKTLLKQIRSKSINSTTECFVCCKDDGKKNNCVACTHCNRPACLSCLGQWWTSDGCKMHITMPCCKNPAMDLLFVCSSSNKFGTELHKTLEGALRNAVLEQERTKRFRYEQFVRNKRHADTLKKEISINNTRKAHIRITKHQAEEGIKHLLSSKGLAEQLRTRGCNDRLGALEIYCCLLETPFGMADTDATLGKLPRTLQRAEDNDIPIDADLIRGMSKEYHTLVLLRIALMSSICRRLQKACAQGLTHQMHALVEMGIRLGYWLDMAVGNVMEWDRYRGNLGDLMKTIRGSDTYIKQIFESFDDVPPPPNDDSHKRKRSSSS
jgi:hypothetical protein